MKNENINFVLKLVTFQKIIPVAFSDKNLFVISGLKLFILLNCNVFVSIEKWFYHLGRSLRKPLHANNMNEMIKKMKFKDSGIVINAPHDLEAVFLEAGFKNGLNKKEKSTNTLVFINNKKEFIDFLNLQLNNIEPDSVLWFAYPKGTSKIKTDINRDIIRETGEQYNITTVAAISINDTWSGLRFRPIDKVGK